MAAAPEDLAGAGSLDLPRGTVGEVRGLNEAAALLHKTFAETPGKLSGKLSIAELLDALDAQVEERGLDALVLPSFGDRARPRRFEIAAALNRLRVLRLIS